MLNPLPYWFRSNVHFLFFKNFYDDFYSAKDKAINGKAKTYIVGSNPNGVERTLLQAAEQPAEADGARRLCFKPLCHAAIIRAAA